ncbi:MAG: protein kinase domain-containing protein [Myxococcaceae bacterium]
MSIENFGKYQLIKRLATGGMAQIYLARQLGLEGFQKQLVVKRILPHLAENEEFVRMFLQEARIAARLNHPNVVQIFDFGAEAESYFIAMEYIHGEDVRRVWKRAEAQGESIPVPLVCRVVLDAAAGLDYAHKKADDAGRPLNIVHRDVSPQNILITFEGGVKVVDFGIAKAADQATVTRSGVLKGKYSYMSPEQANGKRVDNRTDIFALGIVLYELLTGTRLFKRSNDVQTLQAVMECKVAPPSEVDARVPKDLDPIVMRALELHPEDRYQTATEMQLALENWLIERKLSSSSVHLANYMQGLYRERLEREKQEGQYLIEELRPVEDGGSDREKATPSRKSKSQTGSRPHDDGEARTTSLKPERSSRSAAAQKPLPKTVEGRPPSVKMKVELPPDTNPRATEIVEAGERSIPTLSNLPPERSPRALLVVLAVVGALLGAAGVGYAVLSRPHPVGITEPVNDGSGAQHLARVTISSEPSGATLLIDGKQVPGATPLEVSSLNPGRHALIVGKEGFRDYQGNFEVPASGVLVVPTITLQQEGAEAVVDAGGEVALHEVELTLKATPEGALISVDGHEQGHGTVSLKVNARRTVHVVATLPNYFDLERNVRVGDGPAQQEQLFLKHKPSGVVAANGTEDPNGSSRGIGMVRFVVQPATQWAEITCNNKKLGQTPMPDTQLPAGTYSCRFVNTDLDKTLTQTVEVKANQTQKVFVKF